MSKEKLLRSIFTEKKIKIGGDTYIVREMNGAEAAEYESGIIKMVDGNPVYDMKGAKKKLVQLTLFDTDGKRVFEKIDISLIDQLPYSVVNDLFALASKVCKLDKGETKN